MPYGEWSVPADAAKATYTPKDKPAAAPAEQLDVDAPEGFSISAHTHSKKGFAMFIVEQADRVERGEFMAQLDKAKARKGWYSRKWGSTPAGFAFKDQAQAVAFMGEIANV